MEIKEEALDVLDKVGAFLKEPELSSVLQRSLSSKTDATWLDIAQTALPIAIESVESSKIVLPGSVKNEIVTDIVLPLIKDKLPWYIKPFAAKLLGLAIDLIVSALNKIFTKQWGKKVDEEPKVEEPMDKAEGTI